MTALDLEAIRKRAEVAICHHDEKSAGRSKHAGPRRDDCGCENCMENRDDLASDAFALCDEVERLRAENAKLREAANAVLRDFTPEHLDLIGVSMAGSKLRDALADLALRGGGG